MEIFDTIQSIFTSLGNMGINRQIVIMVLLGGLFAQSYFNGFTHIGKIKIDAAWRTLIIGSLFVAGLIAVKAIRGPLPKGIWEEYFISYVFSTSLYELILKKAFNKLLIKLGFNQ